MTGTFEVAPGELLAVELPPGPERIDVVGACWSRGAAFLPLDPRWTARERQAVIDLARPAAVRDADGRITIFTEPAPVDDAIAVIVATSGTSGVPRLVELSRGAVATAVTVSLGVLGLGPTDPWVACLSPAHVGGLLVLFRAVVSGCPVVMHDGFDPTRVAANLVDGASVALVPTMLGRVLEALPADASPAGLALIGGGTLDPAMRETADDRGLRIAWTYGLTESCGGVVYDGLPLPGTEIRIVPDGSMGRVELRGPTLMEGYRGDPAATGEAFTTDGWLRTRDAGHIDDEGLLRINGRLDDAIRTGAETVWPEEVERMLARHPDVADVAVTGRADPEWGQRVIAVVVPRDPAEPPTLAELRSWCREGLARFRAPRELILTDRIERTPSGKVRRDRVSPGT
jgi:O-succinylbenzoic acid--CoA ligase